jgi:hypothetical protein
LKQTRPSKRRLSGGVTLSLIGSLGVVWALGTVGGVAAQSEASDAAIEEALSDLATTWALHDGDRDSEMTELRVLAAEEHEGSLVIVGTAPDAAGQERGLAASFELDGESGEWQLVELVDRPNGDEPWFDVLHTGDEEAVLVRANGGQPQAGDLKDERDNDIGLSSRSSVPHEITRLTGARGIEVRR